MANLKDLETEPLLTSIHDAIPQTQEYDSVAEVYTTGDAKQKASIPRRKIGWTSAFILIISRVIGSGIFAMPGTILQSTGSPGLAILLWIIGALLAWCGLVIDLEYGCMLPVSGGMKAYLEFTYPWPRYLASTTVAVSAVLLGFTATNCIVFAKYMLFAFGKIPQDADTKVIAVGLLTFITILHGCFYRTGLWLQNVLGMLKLALVGFMVLVGIGVVFFGRSIRSSTPSPYADLFTDSNLELHSLATSLLKIFYSYAGLNNINNVLNEVENPVQTLKSVAPTALLTACLLYLLINVAYFSIIPLEEIKESRELVAALFFEKLFGAGSRATVLPIMIALSAAGNVMVVTFSLARLNQEIARQGFLPFSKVLASSKPFNAPLGGLIVHFVPSVMVIVLPPSSDVYAFIADVEGYAGQFFSLALAAGLLWLRIKKPGVLRPFKAWVPSVALRIILSTALIFAPLFPPTSDSTKKQFFYAAYALVGLAVLIFALVYWYVWTIFLPNIGGYRLEEQTQISSDGSIITVLTRCHRDEIREVSRNPLLSDSPPGR